MNNLQKLTDDAGFGDSNLSSGELGDINILIGINGGGKTTLLESVYRQINSVISSTNSDINVCFLREEDIEGYEADIISIFNSIINEKGRYLDNTLKLIQSIYPTIVDLSVSYDDRMLYVHFKDSKIPFNGMGAGFYSIVRIIAGVWLARGGCLLIDNLGRGLHLDSTDKVCDYVIESVAQDNTQVFISTHCPTCLSGFRSDGRGFRSSDIESNLKTTVIDVKSAYQLPNDVIDAEISNF